MNFFINIPIGINPKFNRMKKQLTPVASNSRVTMCVRIPQADWLRFGVHPIEWSEYMSTDEPDLFFVGSMQIHEIPQAVADFNAKNKSAFSISDFIFEEIRTIKFEQAKPVQSEKLKYDLGEIAGMALIGVMLAVTLVMFSILMYESISKLF